MRNIVKKNILSVNPYVPGKPIEEVKRELGLKHVIKLASNETPYAPSKNVLKAIAQAALSVNRYPDGGCYHLRQALAKRLKVSGSQLIFGNGSDELIVLSVKAFVNPGDEVIMARPSFLIYEIAAQIADARIRAIPLKNFYYDLEGMLKTITPQTKIIFIGNPDNPSGTYVTELQVENFLKQVPRHVLVFFDEAYYEYVSAKDYPDTLKLLKQYDNIIATRTFSKMYGLAGLRIGYGIASEAIVDILNRVREPFNVNSLAQAAALACLNDGGYYQRIARAINQEREFLYAQLEKLGVSFVKTATNFILINVKADSTKVAQNLLKEGVIIRDMKFWGLNNFIRVTIGTKQENKKFISALKKVL